jgi:arylsulfatase A-like enzyme
MNLLRLSRCILALALLATTNAWRCSAEEPTRPNVVFILVDDLRWDALGCMSHPIAKTPNIDRIAKEGALFKNFFVSIPLCSPSRASFLTGQYAHKHGVTDNNDHSALSHRLVTFPKMLHDGGYETAFIGKWHMGNDDSPRPGFDRWISFKGQGVYQNPALNFDGQASRVDGYITDILNAEALKFVKAEHHKPFLLYLSHKAVHGPFTPAERHKELYADAQFKPAASAADNLEGKPVLTREVEYPAANQGKTVKKKSVAPGTIGPARGQLRALAAVDEGVGQLYQALAENKQLDNTLIIFTSDNGYFWGEHGLGDKRWAYDESIRDPLLMRYPKLIRANTTLNRIALNIDIAPTLLDLAGLEILPSIQGKSLLPLFKNSDAPWRTSFLTEYYQEKQYPRAPSWKCARTERWKFISYADLEGMDELYDLQSDPMELKNLIHDPAYEPRLKEMKAELARLEKATE